MSRSKKIALLLLLIPACGGAMVWNLARVRVRPVIPGELYRSGQPDPDELRQAIVEHGLLSVISTRGDEAADLWFQGELAVLSEFGLDLFSVKLDGDRLPSPSRLSKLIRHIDEAPRPALIHCNWGVERSGLASAIALLLDGESPAVAIDQLTYRDGLARWITQSDLPVVIDDYVDWLQRQGHAHAPDRFRWWARNEYVPYFYSSAVELTRQPEAWQAGESHRIAFQVTNTSLQPWRHRAERDRGVHVAVRLAGLDPGRPWRGQVRTGYVDLILDPAGVTEFEVTLPPFPHAGEYRIEIALVDELVDWFADMGDDNFVKLVVVSAAAL